MTRDQFAALLLEIQEKERTVREEGQKEYAHDADNCFANFDSDGEHGVGRLQSIMSHFNKHRRGIVAFVNGHRSQREDIRGRIKDARLYLALLWAAIEDEKNWQEHGKPVMDYLDSLEDTPQMDLRDSRAVEIALASEAAWAAAATDNHPDGWLYGADPLDELSRRRDMPEPLQGPRYSDIVSAPSKKSD